MSPERSHYISKVTTSSNISKTFHVLQQRCHHLRFAEYFVPNPQVQKLDVTLGYIIKIRAGTIGCMDFPETSYDLQSPTKLCTDFTLDIRTQFLHYSQQTVSKTIDVYETRSAIIDKPPKNFFIRIILKSQGNFHLKLQHKNLDLTQNTAASTINQNSSTAN